MRSSLIWIRQFLFSSLLVFLAAQIFITPLLLFQTGQFSLAAWSLHFALFLLLPYLTLASLVLFAAGADLSTRLMARQSLSGRPFRFFLGLTQLWSKSA